VTTSFAWRELGRRFREHRRSGILVALAFMVSGFLLGTSVLGVRAVGRWSGLLAQDVHVIVYLAEEMDGERAAGLAEILGRLPHVDQARLIDPETARRHLLAAARQLGDSGFETVEASIFPRSIEVSFAPSATLATNVADLAKRLRPVPGVLFVDDMSAGVGQVMNWTRLGKRLGIIFLIAAGVLTLLFPWLALLRFRRRQARRAAVLHQLGATPFSIRYPSALLLGAAATTGGALATLLLALFARPLLALVEASLGLSLGPLPTLPASQVGVALAGLAALGLALGYLLSPMGRDHA
jgi:cell division protein FtsX